MFYRVIKWLFRLTVNGYFRSIYIQGMSSIPTKGPVIFAPNHTSAFMDPILLGVYINRILYFLARGDVFKKKIAGFIFKKVNMIPIYGHDTSPDDVHKNELVFQKCFDHLKLGRTIMIFPEGTSRTERRLRPIKTGVARIALGAEDQNNFELGVTIIPIGINYSNPHSFRSDVFINFGNPIYCTDFKGLYKDEPWNAVLKLTDVLKEELEKRVVVIEDERLDKLIKQIEILYRSKLRDESRADEKGHQDFYLSKDIVSAVEHYAEHHVDQMIAFEKKINNYLNVLKRLKIRDTQIRTSSISFNLFWRFMYFAFGAPLFLYGLIFNIIPYKLAEFASNKILVRHDFIGSLKIASGMLIFLLMYILEGVLVANFFYWYWGVAFVISLYPAGIFTINYLKTYYQFRGNLAYVGLFIRKSDLIAGLKTTRQELVDELEAGKEVYLSQVKPSEK